MTEPGWHPDPADETRLHFWDGSAWTLEKVWDGSGWVDVTPSPTAATTAAQPVGDEPVEQPPAGSTDEIDIHSTVVMPGEQHLPPPPPPSDTATTPAPLGPTPAPPDPPPPTPPPAAPAPGPPATPVPTPPADERVAAAGAMGSVASGTPGFTPPAQSPPDDAGPTSDEPVRRPRRRLLVLLAAAAVLLAAIAAVEIWALTRDDETAPVVTDDQLDHVESDVGVTDTEGGAPDTSASSTTAPSTSPAPTTTTPSTSPAPTTTTPPPATTATSATATTGLSRDDARVGHRIVALASVETSARSCARQQPQAEVHGREPSAEVLVSDDASHDRGSHVVDLGSGTSSGSAVDQCHERVPGAPDARDGRVLSQDPTDHDLRADR